MTMYTENMENEVAAGELVPEGIYEGRITKVEDVKSKEKGTPGVEVTVTITTEGPAYGQRIRSWCSLVPGNMWNLKAFYNAVNYNPGPEGHDPETLLESEIKFTVKHVEQKGNTYANIVASSIKSLIEF